MDVLNPGPIVTDLLTDQGSHRSTLIWNSGRVALNHVRTYNHSWRGPDDPRITANIITAGFYGLHCIPACKVDRGLISALLDRWRHESHTFHFIGGELGISLQDVEIMLGLRVDGRAVIRFEEGETRDTRLAMVGNLLGVVPELEDVDKNALYVKKSWMDANFVDDVLQADADELTVTQYSRAAILYLLTSQFFSDKHGDLIALWPLPFLMDFESCSEYSWGSALLAYLEHNMCKLVVKKVDGISGALIFLRFWAYTRIRAISPISGLPPDYVPPPGMPRYSLAARWAGVVHNVPHTVDHNVVHIRDQFDQLTHEQIVWEPYGDIDSYPEYCTRGRAIWHAVVPLICMMMIEWHPDDRFKRQFGFNQAVQTKPWNDKKAHGKDRRAGGGKSTNLPVIFSKYVQCWEARHERLVQTVPAIGDGTSHDYHAWYQSRTRLRINPPIVDVPEYGFRPVGGIRHCMEEMLRHNLQSFQQARMQSDVDYLLSGFEYLRINPYASKHQQQPHSQPHMHNDDDNDDNDDRRKRSRGRGGPSRSGGSEGPSRSGGGGGPSHSGGGGGPSRSGGGPSRMHFNDDEDDDEEMDMEIEMETPYHHRQSTGPVVYGLHNLEARVEMGPRTTYHITSACSPTRFTV